MSDIADRADTCAAIEGAGGSFARRGGYVTPRAKILPACVCGGHPVFEHCAPNRKGGFQVERLVCRACGRSVGPLSSRQALALAWRMGGAESRGSEFSRGSELSRGSAIGGTSGGSAIGQTPNL